MLPKDARIRRIKVLSDTDWLRAIALEDIDSKLLFSINFEFLQKAEAYGQPVDEFTLGPSQSLIGVRVQEDSDVVRGLGFIAWSFPIREFI